MMKAAAMSRRMSMTAMGQKARMLLTRMRCISQNSCSTSQTTPCHILRSRPPSASTASHAARFGLSWACVRAVKA